MLIAHATFKAPLFFVVGIIDTSAGTRDLTKLSGLGRSMPAVAVMADAGGDRMAGIPPMIGFAAKEAGYAGLLDGGTAGADRHRRDGARLGTDGRLQRPVPVGCVRRPSHGVRDRPSQRPHPAWMTGPTLFLVVLGLVLGVCPGIARTAAAVVRADRRPDPRGRDGALARTRTAARAVGGGLAGRRRDLLRSARQGTAGPRSPGPAANPEPGTGRRPGGWTRSPTWVTCGHPARVAAGFARRDPVGAGRLPRADADQGGHRAEGCRQCSVNPPNWCWRWSSWVSRSPPCGSGAGSPR